MQPTPNTTVEEFSPHIGLVGRRNAAGEKLTNAYDLVEQMQYLYVRVVKARGLLPEHASGIVDPYVEVRLGKYKTTTRHREKTANPEWNQLFAFSRLHSSAVHVVVKDKDVVKDEFMGVVGFDLNKVPEHAAGDSPLAPQWYRLEDWQGKKVSGEIMLAVWLGTQADEAFREAWLDDTAGAGAEAVSGERLPNTRSRVYLSPVLWYLRVHVIEAQGLQTSENPQVYVKAILGYQVSRTKTSQSPIWNEDLMFVAAEPFEELLIVSVENIVEPHQEAQVMGKVFVPLQSVERRLRHKEVRTRWCNLVKDDAAVEGVIHLRICLDGGYHVFDESMDYSSDLRPTAKQLWQPSIGVVELGILGAQQLLIMNNITKDGHAYCVAKYGRKWVRTRTVVGSSAPRWNEQYAWEVFDPCTVITVGVFHNSHLEKEDAQSRDYRFGKVRIRLFDTGNQSGLRSFIPTPGAPSNWGDENGGVAVGCEVHLFLRGLLSHAKNLLWSLLPKMHYHHPLPDVQLDSLRYQATQIVSMRLARAEPPLRKEVVEYMLDAGSRKWSSRRSKAKSLWIMGVLNWLIAVGKWFDQVWDGKNPGKAILIHVVFAALISFPRLILPTMFMCLFLIGIRNYGQRPSRPPHLDVGLSHADSVHPDELDEEFDPFPTSRPEGLVRMRYDRMRIVGGRIAKVVGNVARQGERVQALLSWRDPRATALFLVVCLIAAIVLYFTPFKVVAIAIGFYMLRPPCLRHKLPSAPLNYFRRLPEMTDYML